MQDKEQFYNSIVDSFCNDGFYYEDVRIEIPAGFLKTVKRDFDLIVFNNKAIIAFAALGNVITEREVISSLRAAFNSLVNRLSVSLRTVIICGINEQHCFFLNGFNDKLITFGNSEEEAVRFLDLIDVELGCRPNHFDYEQMREMGDKIVFSSSAKAQGEGSGKIKTASDGRVYVRKQGVWKEASDVDSDQAYILASLTGMIGGHLFYLKKPGKGILYLLTLGLFGVGWFFDSLEIMFGIYKDRDGRYLLPVSNKLLGFGLLLAGVAVYGIIWFVLSLFLKIILG